ncbi:MAG: alanine racemase [Pseudomonadota bacterium]
MRPTLVTLHTAAFAHNLAVVRSHAPHSKVMAVIKANAYGHGLLRAARALHDADAYAVLELDAGVRLRDAGFQQPIVLLEGFFEARELPVLAGHRLTPVIHQREQLEMLADWRGQHRFDVLLKLNSGMNRLGFDAAAFPAALQAARDNPRIASIMLMTHFADADDGRGVDWQMQRFAKMVQSDELPRTLANSAAILRYPHTHADWVRPGIMLYGASPFAEQCTAQLGLRPAMTLSSRIIAVQELQPGERIGYGGLFVAEQAMRVGIVACGYADGYPRHAPGGTPVLVEGRRTQILGRVSMDMLYVDLCGLPKAGVGSAVTLWGEGLSVEEVAHAAGTISYELLCAVTPRVAVAEE